jgi:hypothetical protein
MTNYTFNLTTLDGSEVLCSAPGIDLAPLNILINAAKGDVLITTNKIRLKEITILWSEAGDKHTGKTFQSFKDCESYILREIARYAPVDGSYHKTQLNIEFRDGTHISYRWDVTRGGTINHLIDWRKSMDKICRTPEWQKSLGETWCQNYLLNNERLCWLDLEDINQASKI